ncbi:hypothetical protein Moror_4690 [Moniliophthora roreri MCA 2997]|uniref:T6SS Phospholipase effector Tle1-like catalytic domain-containing protein n=2 Tax=Moniliophthora roreri TaxID=221103 RepID=V2XEZ8_MONRO|nr:hypothetical protein Moror_4690 [Moniliophthora roreri MCA 2997]KAI3613196.1 hypothetical protein WG66_001406 [Moniliophthora roreri]
MTGHTRESTILSLTDTVVLESEDSSQPILLLTAGDKASPPATTDEATLPDTPPKSYSPFNNSKPLPVRKEETLDSRMVPPTIPPEHSNRTLIVCFDGTGDQFDCDNSNIVQFFSLLKKDDKSKQMVYYQAGIGTYTSPQVATPLMSKLVKTLDEMVALHLDAHVMGGYEFLMQNYVAGDRICIFGFSRGAYTARSLAGMIHKVGLLPADNWQQVPFAYKMYTRTDQVGWEQSNAFKRAFSVDVTIEFVGVWDTVDSVGLVPKRLPFTTSNTILRTFRHAVSLDERRAKFKANLWNRPTAEEAVLGASATHLPPNHSSRDSPRSSPDSKKKEKQDMKKGHRPSESPLHWLDEDERDLADNEGRYSAHIANAKPTDIEEVWFAGCHCDVGGGSVSNDTRHSLSRISLRWMIRECFKTNTGIMFDSQKLREIGLDPTSLYPFVTPRPPRLSGQTSRIQTAASPRKPLLQGLVSKVLRRDSNYKELPVADVKTNPVGRLTEEEEELHDAMAPIYDQLEIAKTWWILELIPMQFRYQKGSNEWVSWFGMNLARPRFIPKQKKNGVKVHRSVKTRMEASHEGDGKKYLPRAYFSIEPTWVD